MITDNPQDGERITENEIATRQFFSFTDQVTKEINDTQTTTEELENIASTVNVNNKVLSKRILNITTGATVFASGTAAGAVWHYYDSTTAHTPV